MMRTVAWIPMLAVALGCAGEDPVELVVDLRTDYVPGVEFTQVRIELLEDDRQATTDAAALSYVDGARVFSLGDLQVRSPRPVRLSLLDADSEILAERELLVEHRSALAITVVISRSCADVTCPAEAGASETSCLGGRCVEPTCVSGEEEACLDPACEVGSDCPERAACASPICASGVCLYEPGDGCPDGQLCDLDQGCVPVGSADCEPVLDRTFELLAGDRAEMGVAARPTDPIVAFDGERFWVALTTEHRLRSNLFFRSVVLLRMACDGTVESPSLVLSEEAYRPTIALQEDRALVVCQPLDRDLTSGCIRAYDRASGAPAGEVLDVPVDARVHATLARADGGFTLVGNGRLDGSLTDVFIQELDEDGVSTGPATRPLPDPGASQWEPNAVLHAGGPALVFVRAEDGTGPFYGDEVVAWSEAWGPVAFAMGSPTNWTPGIVDRGDVVWVAVGPRYDPFRSDYPVGKTVRLFSITDAGPTEHEAIEPPAESGNYLTSLFPAEGGAMGLTYTRRYADGRPTEALARRLGADGETLTVGPEVTIPTDAPVVGEARAVAGAHVTGDVFLLVWTESSTQEEAVLRARFMRL